MPNMNGKAYGLTALFPILNGIDPQCAEENLTHQESLRFFLANLPQQDKSLFSRSPKTHLARFVVVQNLPFNGEPYAEDRLASPWLLFTACFNFDLEPWLNTLWQDGEQELKDIFKHCVAGDLPTREAFVAYVKQCQVNTSFLFADYPNHTVEEVLRGLQLKKSFVELMGRNQGVDDAQLQKDFLDWCEQMDQEPLAVPGSVF